MVGKVCKVISTILLVLLLLLAAVLVGPPLLGMKNMAVLSGSMEPAFSTGDMVIVKPEEPSDIAVGDIITFSMPGSDMVATHRVIEKRENAFVTKGDANLTDDGEISFERLVGKVVLSLPKMGYFTSTIKSRDGILIGAGLLIALVLLTFLPEIFKKNPDKESENSGKQS